MTALIRTLAGLAAIALLGLLAWQVFGPGAAEEPVAPAEPVIVHGPREVDEPAVDPVRIVAGSDAPKEWIAPLPRKIADQVKARASGNVLHGSVVDAISGEPVTKFAIFCAPSDADIRLHAEDARNARIFPNDLGTFTFYGLASGRYNLMVRRTEYEELIVPGVDVPQQGDLVLRLSPGAFIDGRVVGSDGAAVEGEGGLGGIEVRLEPVVLDDPSKAPSVLLKNTNPDGRFRFSNLPSGTYRVRLANDSAQAPLQQEFYVAPGRGQTVTFTLPDQNEVKLVVKDREGQALNEVHVKLWPSAKGTGLFTGVTDNEGRLTFEYVPAGEYTVKLYKAGYLRKLQPLALRSLTGTYDVDVVLDPSPWDEENPTLEQIQRLRNGERPEDVFGEDG